MKCTSKTLLSIFCAAICTTSLAEEPDAKEVRRFKSPEAFQAVAVGKSHFYAIGNAVIGKYRKDTGELTSRWSASSELPLRHLNSGLVKDGLLYCAHSNYPKTPEASSVEIFATKRLTHVDSHSFGFYEGSLTWVDWHQGAWWAVFAHYSKKGNDNLRTKPHTYTSLVRFDDQWRRTGGWIFPDEVLDRFAPNSCSGGGWGPDGFLYCTGHDRGEVYCLALPRAGSELVLRQTIPVNITGQGIAWDTSQKNVLYGINRLQREVVVLQLNPLKVSRSPRGRSRTPGR